MKNNKKPNKNYDSSLIGGNSGIQPDIRDTWTYVAGTNYVEKDELEHELKTIKSEVELTNNLIVALSDTIKANSDIIDAILYKRDFLWNAYENKDWRVFKHLSKKLKKGK